MSVNIATDPTVNTLKNLEKEYPPLKHTGTSYQEQPTKAIKEMAVEKAQGVTFREIAARHDTSPATAFRILSKDEVKQIIETETNRIISMVPKAVKNYDRLMNSIDDKICLQASDRVMEITGIKGTHTSGNTYITSIINASGDINLVKTASILSDYLSSRLPQDEAIDAEIVPEK